MKNLDNKTQIENILRTLPFNFYTKTNDKATLTVEPYKDEVYINLIDNHITVGLEIFDLLDELTETKVRSIFYHEVSHAILTEHEKIDYNNFTKQDIINECKKLNLKVNENLDYTKGELRQVLNIIEDERIETILKDYYLSVNFKDNIITVLNKTIPEEAKEPSAELMRTLRKREGQYTKLAVNLLQPLLKEEVESKDYLPLLAFYASLKTENTEQEKDNKSGENGEEQQSKGTQQGQPESDENQEEKQQSNTFEKADELDADEVVKNRIKKIKAGQQKEEEKKAYFRELNKSYTIETLIKKLELREKTKSSMLGRRKGQSYINNGGINVYTLIDMKENKYKIFETDRGQNKQRGTNLINFIIDKSGSFCGNEEKVNKILNQLMKLEKKMPNFKFTLTTIEYNNEETHTGDNRLINCGGGTSLSRNFEKMFNNIHKKSSHTIFLLDGYTDLESPMKNLDFMDKRGVYICVDESNETYFSNFNRAKVDLVISDNYTDYLETFIIKSLTSMLLRG